LRDVAEDVLSYWEEQLVFVDDVADLVYNEVLLAVIHGGQVHVQNIVADALLQLDLLLVTRCLQNLVEFTTEELEFLELGLQLVVQFVILLAPLLRLLLSLGSEGEGGSEHLAHLLTSFCFNRSSTAGQVGCAREEVVDAAIFSGWEKRLLGVESWLHGGLLLELLVGYFVRERDRILQD